MDYVRNITHPHLDGRDLSAEIRGLNTANDEVFRDNECGFVPSVSSAATGDGDGDGYSDGQIASSIGFRSRSASTVLLGIDPFMEGAALRNGRWKIIARPAKVPNSGWSHNVTGGMNTSTPAAPAPQPRHPFSADSNSRAGGDVGGGGRDHESVPAALWVPPTNGQPVWELYVCIMYAAMAFCCRHARVDLTCELRNGATWRAMWWCNGHTYDTTLFHVAF